MIKLGRFSLLLLVGGLATFMTALAMGAISSPVDGESAAGLAVLTVIVEFVAYYLLSYLSGLAAGAGRCAAISISIVIVRFLIAAVASLALALPGDVATDEALFRTWVGNPIGTLIQGLVLAVTFPHLLATIAPSFLSERGLRVLTESISGGEENVSPLAEPVFLGEQTQFLASKAVVSGSVQLFSYDELQAFFRKAPGLEGFLIYSAEGLVQWRDIPFKLDADEFAARLMTSLDGTGALVEGFGLTRMRNLVIEAKEHLIFSVSLNGNFGLVLIFSSHTSPEECWSRVSNLSKSAREFLEWKYPGLGSIRQLPSIVVEA